MHSLTCYTFDFIHIVSSAGINKCITREFDCLPYLRFLLLFLPLEFINLGLLQHLKWSFL